MKKVIALLAVSVIIVFACCSCGLFGGSNDEKITLEEYNQIKTGMTYEEVCEIIGSEGTLEANTDIGVGEAFETEIYQWSGDGIVGAKAIVSFMGGKVISKQQVGLK